MSSPYEKETRKNRILLYMTDKILWGVTFGAHDAAIEVFVNNELVFDTDAEMFS